MSDIIETRLPCDDCGSSDGKIKNENGSHFCFVCDKYTAPTGERRAGCIPVF